MRTIALEEHFAVPALHQTATTTGGPAGQYLADVTRKLFDLGDTRLADMDGAGIDMQVLSLSALHGLDRVDPETASSLAREANDVLAETVRRYPTRFAGFATLALRVPEDAASELERCVTKLGFVGAMVDGTVGGRFLDDPCFEPVLAAAERLAVPIYLHPAPPPDTVRTAYYSGLPESVAYALSISGWGWHVETGLHSLRLIVAGVFDRFPRLQVIIGHLGEFIPYGLARIDLQLSRAAPHLQRRVGEYFRANVHVTTSGYFALPPLLCALMVLGADRILFAVDYPYSPNAAGRKLLDTAPLSPDDLELIAHRNAERLLPIRS